MRVVFFDIGNVLVRFDAGALAMRLAAAVSKRPMPIAELVISGRLPDRIERGRLTARAFHRLLSEKVGFRGDYESFRRVWCGHFRLDRAAYRLFLRVARTRRVFLLSNTNEVHYAHLRRRYAFVRRADGAALSHRLGMRKPQRGIYLAALRMARVPAGKALFIDDLEANVRGAREVGIRSILYRGPEALERELKALGVLRTGRTT